MGRLDMDESRKQICYICGKKIDYKNQSDLHNLCLKCRKNYQSDYYDLIKIMGMDAENFILSESELWDMFVYNGTFSDLMEEYFENDNIVLTETSLDQFYETIYMLTREEYIVNNENGENKEQYEDEESVKKRIHRYVKLFKELNVDLSDLNDERTRQLILFLMVFSVKEKVRYKELFKPYLENLENISEEEKTKNGELIGKISFYLRRHCREKFIKEIESAIGYMQDRERKLLEYLKDMLYNSGNFKKKNEKIYEAFNGSDESVIQDNRIEPLYVFEQLYLYIICYEAKISAIEQEKICSYILQLETTNKCFMLDICNKLYHDRIPREECLNYLQEEFGNIQKLTGTEDMPFDIASKWVSRYLEIMDQDIITGLELGSMLTEVSYFLRDRDMGKNVSKKNTFYKHSQSDKQRNFLSILKQGKSATFFMREIMQYRLEACMFSYLGRIEEYKTYLTTVAKISEYSINVYCKVSNIKYSSEILGEFEKVYNKTLDIAWED